MRTAWRVGLVLLAGCNGSHEPSSEAWPVEEWRAHETSEVDLLLMIDNSNDMVEEQAALNERMEHVLGALTTGDIDGDGTAEQPAVASLHVGVVYSDMGTDGYRLPTCTLQPFGYDGMLIREGNTATSGCAEHVAPFVTIEPGSDLRARAMDVACVARSPYGGCGWEQPLEAVLKGVTPSTSPIRFTRDTRGHADGANEGFLRERSLLAVVLLTDEDDASAWDTEVLTESPRYPADLNTRAYWYPEAFHPPARYAEGLLALRAAYPDRLLFAPIAGVPIDAEPADDLAGVDARRSARSTTRSTSIGSCARSVTVSGRSVCRGRRSRGPGAASTVWSRSKASSGSRASCGGGRSRPGVARPGGSCSSRGWSSRRDRWFGSGAGPGDRRLTVRAVACPLPR